MSRKKIKIQIPSVSVCLRCKEISKVNDIRIEKDKINVSYMCDCGFEYWKSQAVEFI